MGTWIDGKPLYQRTWDAGAVGTGTGERALYSPLGSTCKLKNYFAVTSTGQTLPYFTGVVEYSVGFIFNNGSISAPKISTNMDRSGMGNVIITAQYTKTTDTSNSDAGGSGAGGAQL